MRDRLIELICKIECKGENWRDGGCALRKDERCIKIDNLDMCMIGCIADNLLANGVIVPPCKVGDTVYQTDGVRIYESRINEICIFDFVTVFYTEGVAFDEEAIDNSIFLTREEAEKALAERSGE